MMAPPERSAGKEKKGSESVLSAWIGGRLVAALTRPASDRFARRPAQDNPCTERDPMIECCFEQGPIRPPSEARCLLIRPTAFARGKVALCH
jgi:hypothetical protein